MKLTLRILLAVHICLIIFGIYSVIFEEEYIRSSKYIFIGFTGVLVFLNTLLLFPIKVRFQNILLSIGLALYFIAALGFFFPIIFKNYWGLLFGFAMFLFLMSLFIYSGKRLFENKLDYAFLLGSGLVAFPFVFEIKQNGFVLFTGGILAILSVVILTRIFKNQSK
jgi:hypothetical protein